MGDVGPIKQAMSASDRGSAPAGARDRRVRRIVSHAYRRVRFYRALFDRAGLTPTDILGVSDLHRVPITSCQDYRSNPVEHLLSRGLNPARLICHRTSGSSSAPFTIYRAPFEEHLLNLFRIRAYDSAGVKPSDRLARVKLVGLSGRRSKLLRALRNRALLYRDHEVDCLQTSEAVLRQLEQLRCDVLLGYPSRLTHLASVCAESSAFDVRPRLIITGGESLTPFERQRLHEGFGARTFDVYGANELNTLAWQCPETSYYHVCDDSVALEVVKDGQPVAVGERGEVVATGLLSRAMPFIRYSLGDLATRGPERCPCGAPFSTLRSIQGRVHDYFTLPSGPLWPNEISIPIVMEAGEWFDRYRLVQETLTQIVLHVLPLRPPSHDELTRVEQLGRERLGTEVEFSVALVDELPFDPSGKFRISRSRVSSHLEGTDWERL